VYYDKYSGSENIENISPRAQIQLTIDTTKLKCAPVLICRPSRLRGVTYNKNFKFTVRDFLPARPF